LKFPKYVVAHLLWLSTLASPVLAQAPNQYTSLQNSKPASLPFAIQEPQSVFIDSLTEKSLVVLEADTIYPGQKKPFVLSQTQEGDNKRFLKRAVLPAFALIGAGIYTMQDNGIYSSHDLRDARDENFSDFSTKTDDFIMYAPLVGMYGFNLISSQNRHEIPRQTALLLAAGGLTSAIVWPTKKLTNIDRPNGENHAFPSGHTAYAFTIATFMDKEFRHKSPWVSVASYSVAGATGVLRVLNDKHWMADVLAGAGVGILSVNTVYWLHAKLVNNQKLKDKGLNTTFGPTILPTGNTGMGLTVKF
jgi:hypothetical protein